MFYAATDYVSVVTYLLFFFSSPFVSFRIFVLFQTIYLLPAHFFTFLSRIPFHFSIGYFVLCPFVRCRQLRHLLLCKILSILNSTVMGWHIILAPNRHYHKVSRLNNIGRLFVLSPLFWCLVFYCDERLSGDSVSFTILMASHKVQCCKAVWLWMRLQFNASRLFCISNDLSYPNTDNNLHRYDDNRARIFPRSETAARLDSRDGSFPFSSQHKSSPALHSHIVPKCRSRTNASVLFKYTQTLRRTINGQLK